MLSSISNLNQTNRIIFNLGVILCFSILIMLPIFVWGIPGGADMPQHFQFAQTYYDSITNGNFYPGWAHLPNNGYGNVSVRFYPPLTYYILSFFRWASGDWFDAACLTFTLLFFISGVGIYLWSREWFSHNASLVGALAYIYLPYHVNQLYQFSLFAEFTGAAVLPFCFLYATRVCNKGRLLDICGLAISFGLLVLSHLPLIIMASFTLLLYCIFSLKRTTFIPSIFKLSASVLLSLLLTSFYWLRMVTELDFVKHNSETFSTDSSYYDYKLHFVLGNLQSPLTVLTLVTLGILVPNLILYFLNAKETKHSPITNVIAATIFPLLMITPLSLKIWEFIPAVQKIQFPWRWLIMVSLGCAIIVAAGFETVVQYLRTSRRYLSLLTIGLMLVCVPFIMTRMNHLFYYPKEFFNPLVVRLAASTSGEYWWTIWTPKASSGQPVIGEPRPEYLPEKVVINGRPFEIGTWVSTERRFKISAGEAGQSQVATMYYPHWKAIVNGQSVEVTPTTTGMISFRVPAEESEVRLYFEEPALVHAAFYISGAAWIIIFGFLLFTYFRRSQIGKQLKSESI